MKNIWKLVVGALIATCTMVTTTGMATATQPDTVHHPECPEGATILKSQPPNEGFEVTIPDGYSNITMFIKIGNEHVPVGYVSAGETYGPVQLSGWPRNVKGQPQEISHVDYCVPNTPPTTEPPVITDPPVTTQPPVTTGPPPVVTNPPPVTTVPVTTQPQPCFPLSYEKDAPCQDTDPCVLEDGVLASGFTIGNGDANDRIGSTLWLAFPCYVPVPNPAPTTVATPVNDLPETGSNSLTLLLASLALMALGGGSMYLARRRGNS